MASKDKKIKQLLNSSEPFITDSKWNQLKMAEQCQNIKIWYARSLNMKQNGQPKILKHIHDISFPSLKQIYFWSNNIDSIEGVTRIRMPSLERISMGINNLTIMREFRKAHWPNLFGIFMAQNKMVEANKICQLYCARLTHFRIQYNTFEVHQVSNVKWLAKLQSCKLKVLGIKSEMRLQQEKFKNVLKRKFLNIQINEN